MQCGQMNAILPWRLSNELLSWWEIRYFHRNLSANKLIHVLTATLTMTCWLAPLLGRSSITESFDLPFITFIRWFRCCSSLHLSHHVTMSGTIAFFYCFRILAFVSFKFVWLCPLSMVSSLIPNLDDLRGFVYTIFFQSIVPAPSCSDIRFTRIV